MSSEWTPIEQMLGPELCERFMYHGPKRGDSTSTSTSIPAGTSTSTPKGKMLSLHGEWI